MPQWASMWVAIRTGNNVKRKTICWLSVIIVSAILFQVGVFLTLRTDENVAKLKAWLSTHPDIVQSVGEEMDVYLKNRTAVEQIAGKPRFVRYTLLLTGSEGKARIVIEAYDDADKCIIVSLKPM